MSRTVAVLGARDSGAAELAESLGPAAARAGLVVVTAARPDHRPDVAVLAVDAVCPIRPDDLEVARGVAARVPLVVVLTGARGRDGLAATLETTARRLAANGVPGPVVVAADPLLGAGDSPADGVRRLDAEDLVALLDPARLPAVTAPAEAPASEAADPGRAARETADWLAARRTEVVSSRSSALRQDAQALRLDVVQDLHRGLREVGARARDEIGAARRSALPGRRWPSCAASPRGRRRCSSAPPTSLRSPASPSPRRRWSRWCSATRSAPSTPPRAAGNWACTSAASARHRCRPGPRGCA